MTRLASLSLLVSVALLLGTAAPARADERRGVLDIVGSYAMSRVVDFLDIFKLNASGGLGPGFDVRLTRLLEAGFSDYDVVRVGVNGRRSPIWREQLDEASVSFLGITSGETSRDFFEVGATLHFLVAGAEAAVNVRSIADFLLGFATIDIEKDDWGP